MKYMFLFLLSIYSFSAFSQQLQLHYEPRHTIDTKHNEKNFLTLYFEYFKTQDSGTSFIKPGSFLLKTEADLIGEKNNIGKFYMQVSQSFRCWRPKIFVQLQYSGGLGIAEPGAYGFYINNAFSVGLGHPFQWKNAWFNVYSCYTYNALKKPSHDMLVSFYWWKGFFNYKLEFAGDFNIWTLNKNHGDDYTTAMSGKRISFYGEPQVWYKLNKTFYVGSKINLYYHVFTYENLFEIYPTAAVRCKL
jgi:hypothetical protein